MADALEGPIGVVDDPQKYRAVLPVQQGAPAPWSHEWAAATGNAAASLANIPAAFGSQSALDYKLEKEREARTASQMAAEQGIPQSFGEVGSPMDFGRYAGHLGLQSLPATGSILAGGIAGGMAGGPVGAAVGAGGAAYTWAFGDTLGNQYEQSGQYDVPSAAAAAVPYAAVDAFTGLEGRLIRGFPEAASRGFAGRTATHALGTGISEGVGETFQEGMNSAARMAVDAQFDPFGGDAIDRYKESFLAGAILGGVGGGVAGHFRSPAQPQPLPEPIPQTAPTNLFDRAQQGAMQGPTEQMALDPMMGAINPYDVGGHVSALQRGNAFTIDSPQREMFGGGDFTAPPVQPTAASQPVQSPTTQEPLAFEDEQVGFNPYDVGGFVSGMQDGRVFSVDSPQQEMFGASAPQAQIFDDPQAGAIEAPAAAVQEDPPVLGALKQSLAKTFDEVAGKQPHQRRVNQLLKVVAGATTKQEAKAKLDEAIKKSKDPARNELLTQWRQQFETLMPEDVVTEAPVENTTVPEGPVASQVTPLGDTQTAQPVTDEPQQAPAAPAQEQPAVNEEDREAKLNLLFKTAFGERNASIARDVLEGELTKAEIGKKHGISSQRVSQIGSTRAMVEAVQIAARKLGMSELQLRQLLADEEQVDTAVAEEVEQEVEEYYKPENGFNTSRTVGGSTSGWEKVNNIGELADEWAKAKEAGAESAAKAIEERIKQIRQEAESVDDETAARNLWAAMENEDAPSFDELSDNLKDEWIDNVANGHDTLADMSLIVEKHEAERSAQDVEYSHGKPVNGGSKAPVVRDAMKAKFNSDSAFDARVFVAQTAEDLPAEVRNLADERTQGFTYKGRAYIIASNVDQKSALGVVLHELGAHLGMEAMIGQEAYTKLYNQLNAWAKSGKSGQHFEFAKYAKDKAAQEGGNQKNETIAYFVQRAVDAGVTPTKLKGLVGQWMGAFYNAVRAGLRKLGFRKFDDLSAQEIVDLAYGAAKLTLRGGPVDMSTQKAVMDNVPPQVRAQAEVVTETTKYLAKKGMLGFAFTQDVADMAVAEGMKSAKAYMTALAKADHEKITFEKRIDNILDKVASLHASEQGTGEGSVNKFLRDSRRAKAWGYDDNPANAPADPALKDRFDKMTPRAQQIIKEIFAHGHDTLVMKQQLVYKLADSEFNARLENAQNEQDRARIEKQRASFVKRFSKLMEIDPSQPYVPFKRFGNYVVVGSSQAYADAVAAKDSAKIAELESDPAHREVTFVDSMGEAKALAKAMEQRFGRQVDYFEKEQAIDRIYADGDMVSAFERLRGLIRDQFGEADTGAKAVRQLDTMVSDLLLRTLAETTARKSELRFKDIAGADPDLIRAFASQGRADAHYIAAVKHNNEITTALGKMRGEAAQPGPEKAKRMQYLNEFLLRHAANMEYKPTPIQNQITNVTALWNLLLSPAYYVQNATQPLVISLPYMAGRHQYGRSWKFFTQAYKELGPMIKGAGAINPLDLNNVPADVKDAIHELVARGRIDIGIEQDLGAWADGMTSGVKAKFGALTHKLRGMSNKIETLNRLSTAMAAYRLELNNNGGNKAAAIEYADKVIRVTHGDFTAQATPRYFKNMPLGKVITQFRRFQVMQLSMMARLFHNSFHGEDKWAARKALAYIVGHQMVLAGSLGVPAVSQIAWLFGALFGDDDEPNDPETKMRLWIGNEAIANLILKGAPAMAGLDVSGKIGMGATFGILPYTDVDLSTRDGYAKTLMGISGPFIGGLLPNVTTGIAQFASGDIYRGLEGVMPALVRNSVRAGRFYFEGVTNLKGEHLMSPDEISFFDATAQMLGLPTTTITNQQMVNRAKIKYDQFYNDRSGDLKKEFIKAYNKGDTEAAAAVREKWKELQDARQRNGYKRQPIQELLSAPMKAKRKQVVGGVQVNKNNKGFVEALEDDQ